MDNDELLNGGTDPNDDPGVTDQTGEEGDPVVTDPTDEGGNDPAVTDPTDEGGDDPADDPTDDPTDEESDPIADLNERLGVTTAYVTKDMRVGDTPQMQKIAPEHIYE